MALASIVVLIATWKPPRTRWHPDIVPVQGMMIGVFAGWFAGLALLSWGLDIQEAVILAGGLFGAVIGIALRRYLKP